MKYLLLVAPQPRAFWWALVLLIVEMLGPACAGGQVSRGSDTNPRPAAAPERRAATPTQTPPGPPSCPAVNHLPIQSSQPGHHKVTLSWNASLSSPRHGNASGYCLYRSKTKDPEKEKPPCGDCEQVNLMAFAGTSCVDDIVQDGVTYYYLATAVDASGQPSDWSTGATAPVPPGNQTIPVPAGSTPPKFCRGASAAR